MSAVIWVEEGVGETRFAEVVAGRPKALWVRRWTDAGRFAAMGETYAARVSRAAPALRGAFLDLGMGETAGFLPIPPKERSPPEGAWLTAVVRREAAGGKSAVLRRIEGPAAGPARRLSEAPASDAVPPPDGDAMDAAFEAALDPIAPIPGGGRLIIEPTAALTAIDVDAADRAGSRAPGAFARELNLAAAEEAMRQLDVRSLGGLAVIDFAAMAAPADRAAVRARLVAAGAGRPGLIVTPMSALGLIELSLPRARAPLRERLCDADGRLSAETCAWAGLRAIARAALHARGRVTQGFADLESFAFLERCGLDWRAALTMRIGPMWRLSAQAGLARGAWIIEAP